jgi:GAF domain-containing protein
MAEITLKALVSPRSGNLPAFLAMIEATGEKVSVSDPFGKLLFGEASIALAADSTRMPVLLDEQILGFVSGPRSSANAFALLLARLAARETEGRSLASEVIHLYREVHLIEQLSEQLSSLLNFSAVGRSALEQAQRMIPANLGCILVMKRAGDTLCNAASFGGPSGDSTDSYPESECPIPPDSPFVASVLERGTAEIINNCISDPRSTDSERDFTAFLCAPLRSGQRTIGIIALASTVAGASYSSANLKLLNTIALQSAAALANALLCEEMVNAAQTQAAFAAELHAASTVQQLLLQSASCSIPGFQVDSVYLPASEVGGDFYFVSSAPDGSLIVMVGDVSGKGLTAAMRVAMILGVLRCETSYDPADILSRLNNALIVQGQLGFTTACCIRISLSGDFALANAGHIAPYVSGREIATHPALPLGLVADQTYQLVRGRLAPKERLVLVSDGIPEARSHSGELYGFERLSSLTQLTAQEIAGAAQAFGQDDDITVLTLEIVAS